MKKTLEEIMAERRAAKEQRPDGKMYVVDVAKEMNVCTRTVIRHIKAGRLKAKRVGLRYLINKEDFIEFWGA